jgi:hypothetical protein
MSFIESIRKLFASETAEKPVTEADISAAVLDATKGGESLTSDEIAAAVSSGFHSIASGAIASGGNFDGVTLSGIIAAETTDGEIFYDLPGAQSAQSGIIAAE